MAKVSQKEAGYQDGSPKNCCGYCTMYLGSGSEARKPSCSAVEGPISPYMICRKYYKPFKNPRRGEFSILRKRTPTPTDDWAR